MCNFTKGNCVQLKVAYADDLPVGHKGNIDNCNDPTQTSCFVKFPNRDILIPVACVEMELCTKIKLRANTTSITGKTKFTKEEEFDLLGKEVGDKLLVYSQIRNRKYWIKKSSIKG